MNEHIRSTDAEGQPESSIVLYHREDGSPSIEVRLEKGTVWLSQQQLAELFHTSRENVTMHLRNIYDEGELQESSTSKDFLQVRIEGSRSVQRHVLLYDLDAIISLGYRIKSNTATQFRIWATDRLRDYLVTGYAINQQRLKQIGQVVKILSRSSDELVAGTADVLSTYLPGLELLRDYDAGQISTSPRVTPGWVLTIDESRTVIAELRAAFPDDNLLGNERGGGLQAVIGTIYQSFAGQELYPSVEEKAANLLYLTVKDHPLSDGNKRTAASLFIMFLSRNQMLNDENGQPRINSNALAALTLMVSMSDPKEKDIMIDLVTKMISADKPENF